jgi:hypothetical protein
MGRRLPGKDPQTKGTTGNAGEGCCRLAMFPFFIEPQKAPKFIVTTQVQPCHLELVGLFEPISLSWGRF